MVPQAAATSKSTRKTHQTIQAIEINDTNYQSYTQLPIVAFSFAHEGAMGEPGGIIIVDAEGRDYHANYAYGHPHPISAEHLQAVIPVLSRLNFSIAGCQSGDADWETVYLGYGNYLVLSETITPAFHEAVAEAHFNRSSQLYQQWERIVMSLIGKNKPDHA